MRKLRFSFGAVACLAAQITAAHAQATRTWVSGVGDDVNPCSRTAPCKTFAGAISKTAAGGEIDVLDPGGFGTVTITKAITIDGSVGSIGSILASATNGININAGATDRVILRNLSINGAGTTLGLNGVNFLAGNTLELENVKIMNFSQSCVNMTPSSKANLLISRSSLTSCTVGVVSTGSAGNLNLVQINRSTVHKSAPAIQANTLTAMEISDSVLANNGGGGVAATGATSIVNIRSSHIANNTGFGVQSGTGATVRLSQTDVVNNAGPGLQSTGGQILSWQNNFIAGNAPDGTPTGTLSAQ